MIVFVYYSRNRNINVSVESLPGTYASFFERDIAAFLSTNKPETFVRWHHAPRYSMISQPFVTVDSLNVSVRMIDQRLETVMRCLRWVSFPLRWWMSVDLFFSVNAANKRYKYFHFLLLCTSSNAHAARGKITYTYSIIRARRSFSTYAFSTYMTLFRVQLWKSTSTVRWIIILRERVNEKERSDVGCLRVSLSVKNSLRNRSRARRPLSLSPSLPPSRDILIGGLLYRARVRSSDSWISVCVYCTYRSIVS